MQVSLISPPSWLPSQPFLTLPVLTAFLRREGIAVAQRDLNIEFLEVLLSRKRAEAFYSRMRCLLEKGSSTLKGFPLAHGMKQGPQAMPPEKYHGLREAVELMPPILEHIEEARDFFRSERFYDVQRYEESLGIIDRYLELVGSLFFPSSISTYSNETRYSVYSSNEILSAIQDEEENLFLEIFREDFLPSLVNLRPRIVGISITSTSQMIPGLTLARLIKEKEGDIHVTIGGSIFTKLIDNLLRGDWIFPFVDSFVAFEGEHALLELAHQIEGNGDLRKVPNLLYPEKGSVRINEPFLIEEVNSLPPPDFEGLPLELYHASQRVLPVQTSRGCYWGRCTFCNLHYDHRHFRPKDIRRVIRDIQALKERHGTNYFFFADECIPIRTLKLLAEELPALDIRWIAGARFEEGLTRGLIQDLRKAGCLKLVFGMESYSQRVLDLMRKGIRRNTIQRILKDCLDAGVAVHVYSIVGFPTETVQEAIESANFILENRRLVSSRGFSFLPCLFEMEKHSPITEDPGRYGLRRLMSPKRDDLCLGYFYEVEQGMSPQEAELLHAEILQKANETVSPFPYNYSMSDGLLYLTDMEKER